MEAWFHPKLDEEGKETIRKWAFRKEFVFIPGGEIPFGQPYPILSEIEQEKQYQIDANSSRENYHLVVVKTTRVDNLFYNLD